MSFIKTLSVAAGLSTLMAVTADVGAQTMWSSIIRVRCESSADRSKVSVDGHHLVPGMYAAVVVSGGKRVDSPYDSTIGDEIEFDFDSNPNDINAGATAIPADFIVRNRVTGALVDAAGNVVARQKAVCTRK